MWTTTSRQCFSFFLFLYSSHSVWSVYHSTSSFQSHRQIAALTPLHISIALAIIHSTSFDYWIPWFRCRIREKRNESDYIFKQFKKTEGDRRRREMLLLPRSFSIPPPQCAALPCFFFYSLFNGIRSSTAAVAVMHIRVSLHTRSLPSP
jgi:hypothetical protein